MLRKKSSLGQRPSIHEGVDRSNIRMTSGKKSFIPKPLGGGKSRSSSADRSDARLSSTGRKEFSTAGGMIRSKSYHTIDTSRNSVASYATPQQRVSSAAHRPQWSDGHRASSVGGKSARKESRPINDKHFQIQAQQKVQQFFTSRPDAAHLLDNGNIRPMNVNLFVDLVNFLISKVERRIVVTSANYKEEIINLSRLLNYKGKVEKSWLITVNAPHSWQHVIAFLVWLVELYQVSEVFDAMSTMYPLDCEESGEEETNFRLLTPLLLSGYSKIYKEKQPEGSDKNEYDEYIEGQRKAMNIDETELKDLQKTYRQIQEELNNAEDHTSQQKLLDLENNYAMLKKDIKTNRDYLYEGEAYIKTMKEKHNQDLSDISVSEKLVDELKAQRDALQNLINCQVLTLAQKEQVEHDIGILHQEIAQLNKQKMEYSNLVYEEEIKMAKVLLSFKNAVNEFNKLITMNVASMPSLKEAFIDEQFTSHMNAPDALARFRHIDNVLLDLKINLKQNKVDAENKLDTLTKQQELIESDLACSKEEYEKSVEEVQQLEDAVTTLKEAINKDKELMKAALADLQQKLKNVIKKSETNDENKEQEEKLVALKQRYAEAQEAWDEFVDVAPKTLRNRRANYDKLATDIKKAVDDRLKQQKEICQKLSEIEKLTSEESIASDNK